MTDMATSQLVTRSSRHKVMSSLDQVVTGGLAYKPARPGPEKHGPGLLKILQQLLHMNLSNYFFRTDSVVLMCTACSLLALYFMHEIREIFDIRFMPEISLDKCLTLNFTDTSQ